MSSKGWSALNVFCALANIAAALFLEQSAVGQSLNWFVGGFNCGAALFLWAD